MTADAPLVLCIGDIDVDMLIRVPTLPGLDEKVGGRRLAMTPGGMAANVAVASRRLGARVRLVGAIGDDPAGDFALSAISRESVDVRHVVRKSGTGTFMCLVMLSPEGEKALIRLATEAYLPRPDDVPAVAFDDADHVHLTLGDPDLTLHCLALAKARGIPASLDLEVADMPDDPAVLRRVLDRVDLLFVNRQGRQAVLDGLGPDALAGRTVVTTHGRDGSVYDPADGSESVTAAGVAVDVTDTTGAGDCFAAAFLVQRLEGASPLDALTFANAAAALSTRAFGGQGGLPTAEEVRACLRARAERSRTEGPHA